LKKALLIWLLFLCSIELFAQETNLFDSVNTRKYARYLITAHQYKQAAEEFERLYFLSNENANYLPSLLYSLRKSNQEIAVVQRFQNTSLLNDQAFKEYLFCILKQEKPNSVIDLLNQRTNLDSNTRNTLLATTYIEQYKWKEANRMYSKIKCADKEKITTLINAAEMAKKKNPALAATLSAVVPGLGKLYTGNKKDALMSFIFVGVNAFQSYRYFNKKGIKSVGAWVFGSLATGFYLGNIYGSYKAALHKNKKINDAYQKQIFDITDMD